MDEDKVPWWIYVLGGASLAFFLATVIPTAKSLSYSIWYEDKVAETVHHLVKPECLRND